MQTTLSLLLLLFLFNTAFCQANEGKADISPVKYDWSEKIHFEIKGVEQPDSLRFKKINLQPYLHLLGEQPLEVRDSLSQYTLVIYPFSRRDSPASGIISLPVNINHHPTQKAMPD